MKNCIQLTTQENDVVLDPFMGSGTTAVVSENLNRKWIGFDIDEKYAIFTAERLKKTNLTTFF